MIVVAPPNAAGDQRRLGASPGVRCIDMLCILLLTFGLNLLYCVSTNSGRGSSTARTDYDGKQSWRWRLDPAKNKG